MSICRLKMGGFDVHVDYDLCRPKSHLSCLRPLQKSFHNDKSPCQPHLRGRVVVVQAERM